MKNKRKGMITLMILMVTVLLFGASMVHAATALKITKQPVSVTLSEGSTAKVSFTASGDGLKYKWYYKDKGSVNFTRTTTFSGNTYTARMNDNRAGRQIYCVVTDKYGNSVKTNTVKLSMGTTLSITKQPLSVTSAKGTTAKVSFKAQGDGLKYKWYIKNKSETSFSRSTAFSGNSYSVEMNASRAGRQIYCVVTDKYGSSVRTNTVKMSMGTTLKITKQPVSVTCEEGSTAKVSFAVTGEGLKYKWYYKDKGSVNYTHTTTFSGNTYTAKMNDNRAGRQIYCVVTDKYGSSVQTNTVKLSMGTPLKITKHPETVIASKGTKAITKVTAVGDGLTYKWYYKNKGDSSYKLTTSFKSNRYSVEMNADRADRKVYCVVTDKYGTSVKSNVATLIMGTPLKITKQPVSVTAEKGTNATVKIGVQGEGLKYKWYYKNKGATSFAYTATYTTNSYTVKMDATRSGRQVYCVITDKYGKSVKTNTVTLSMGTPLKITKQPVSLVYAESGETVNISVSAKGDGLKYKWYYKNEGSSQFSSTTSFTGNTYSVPMSCSRSGRQVYCVITDKYGTTVKTNTATMIMKCKYFITLDTGVGEVKTIGVGKDGKYSLATPSISGYTFKGWKDSSGNTFASSGTIKANKTVKAVWTVDGTNTLDELIKRTNAGVRDIKITGNITVNQPIYISYKTNISSSGSYSIKRAPGYSGDMFVVGQDKSGESAVVQGRKAELTLSSSGTLTIDGNRSKTTVDVVGSAIYVADSGTVNIKAGTKIANHKKVGNKRILSCSSFAGETAVKRAGGSAICIVNGIVNMYGGVISNNTSLAAKAVTTDSSGNTVYNDAASCGGAIYNRGNFNMYGGTISTSTALCGGAIYNNKNVVIEAGTIKENTAKTYGGAICSSGDQQSQLFIGSVDSDGKVTVANNKSSKAGGAIYSNTDSPIVIYGKTTFSENSSTSIGGAIYTGGALTVRNTVFSGNTSSSQGGAIYHKFSKTDVTRRDMLADNCTFKNNKAADGGAIALGAAENSAKKGTNATIRNCTFESNKASSTSSSKGNGGAIYVTYYSDAAILKCTFKTNTATGKATAVYVHMDSKVKVTDCTLSGNTIAGDTTNVQIN